MANTSEKTSLAALQAESLYSMITASGGKLPLHKSAMRLLKRQGFNRADIANAIDQLASAGRIVAAGTDIGVVLELAGG